MATTKRPVVIGVFRDRALAEQAIDELRRTGFRDDQIRLLGHSSGGVLTTLRSMFSRQEAEAESGPDDLISQGVPEENVDYYQRELEAGSAIVIVQAHGYQQRASDILYRHGAYDATHLSPQIGGDQTVQVRKEELQVGKQWVQVGEVRIHKKVITEEKTFTVSVTREELEIERHPASDQPSNRQVAEEELLVEHHPASSRPATNQLADDDATTRLRPVPGQPASRQIDEEEALREGGTLRIVLREEQVVIEKRPVVIEEILISKRLIQETKNISEEVKREEVHIERKGNVIIHGDGVEEVAP